MTLFSESQHPWLGIEIRHLATLEAIARLGSFRSAAEELGYVQSAVSQQVSRLERQLGIRLIDRSRGRPGVTLTPAGQIVSQHARDTLTQLGAAAADLRAAEDDGQPTIRLGVCGNVTARLVADVFAEGGCGGGLGEVCSLRGVDGFHVLAHEAATRRQLLSLVERGLVDAAVVDLPLRDGPFACQALSRDPCVLVVASDSPMARRGGVPDLAEVAAFPLAADPSWPILTEVDAAFRAAGAQPRFAHRAASARAVQALAASGAAAALMSPATFDPDDPRTVGVSLDGLLPTCAVALVRHAERRDARTLACLSDLAEALRDRLSSTPATQPVGSTSTLAACSA